MTIRTEIRRRLPELAGIRRDLHQIPETAFQEFKTSSYIQSFLEKLKPDRLDVFCETGVRALFLGADENRTIAVRADMDALPVREETGLPFTSRHEGKMHACGHDGHMAMALMAASLCSEARDRLPCSCAFVFQPGEESEGGAKPLIEAGILEAPHVDEIYGLHLWPTVEKGILALKSGPLMAGTSDFDLILEGSGGHGAQPQDGTDAIVAGAWLVNALQTIVSRSVNPEKAAVLTIGKINGGVANNVLCEKLVMEGTVRTFDREVTRLILSRMEQCMEGTAEVFRVGTRRVDHMAYPPVINDVELYEKTIKLLDPGDWKEATPVMMSEDFAYYQEKIPGLFAFLGTGGDEPLHSSRFSFDENVLACGVEYFARVLGLE